MDGQQHILLEKSLQIAWNYLDRMGELEQPEIAGCFLIDAIGTMMRQGVQSQFLRSNRAIRAYQRATDGRRARLRDVPNLNALVRQRLPG